MIQWPHSFHESPESVVFINLFPHSWGEDLSIPAEWGPCVFIWTTLASLWSGWRFENHCGGGWCGWSVFLQRCEYKKYWAFRLKQLDSLSIFMCTNVKITRKTFSFYSFLSLFGTWKEKYKWEQPALLFIPFLHWERSTPLERNVAFAFLADQNVISSSSQFICLLTLLTSFPHSANTQYVHKHRQALCMLSISMKACFLLQLPSLFLCLSGLFFFFVMGRGYCPLFESVRKYESLFHSIIWIVNIDVWWNRTLLL